MAVRIRNTPVALDPPTPPRKADGGPYRWEMIYSDGWWRGYADTHIDLVDMLVPEYATMADERRREARLRHAVDIQVRIQAHLATSTELDSCTPEQRAIILGSRATPPTPDHWDAPVPLVLVTTFYQPSGEHPRPTGPVDAVRWIDPSTERSLLISLHDLSAIHLATTRPNP